jgi:hypothetical protein
MDFASLMDIVFVWYDWTYADRAAPKSPKLENSCCA